MEAGERIQLTVNRGGQHMQEPAMTLSRPTVTKCINNACVYTLQQH